MPVTKTSVNNLEYLATRLHARRSWMAEDGRLDALCHLRTIPELGRAVRLDTDYETAADLQRRLVRDLVHELAGFAKHVGGPGGDLYSCLLVRFQIENVKILIRGLLNRISPDEVRSHWVPLPENLALDLPKLSNAGSLEDLAALLPAGKPFEQLREAVAAQRDHPTPFPLEMALDHGYFQEVLAKTRQLTGEDLANVRPLILQEVNLFQLLLVVRGKFLYGLTSDSLLAWRLTGTSDDWFKSLLIASDMLAAAKSSFGIVLDELPSERTSDGNTVNPAVLEALGWKRYRRLANSAFRRGHMGLGAVIGYAGLRRVEVANLITLSEAVRLGAPGEEIRARLIGRTSLEAAHV